MKPLVRLRSAVNSDSDILFKWINNHDLVIFNSPFREISRLEHDDWFARIRDQEDVSFFMIENLSAGLTIGSCQLLNIHPVHRSAELQIRIGEMNFQNQGAGSEAVRQLTEYGFSKLGLHRISLHVFANNSRAIHVYKKNGYIQEGLLRQVVQIDGHWTDVACMAKIQGIDD